MAAAGSMSGYSREKFPHWATQGNSCDTREKVFARDYEALPARSEAMVHVAMINFMTRRLTGETTPSWRGT
ncbi:hypothetical protein GCM10023235_78240 [Kitasatospora terrestris]|uniref:Transposase n=1 Tax=Kitasatospora terrestris TaxID=258051 RepID=A0ABP9F0V0_9ACTN